LKKTEVEQALLQNNGKDVSLSENKVSHECETPMSKFLDIGNKFEGLCQSKKNKRPNMERKWVGRRKKMW